MMLSIVIPAYNEAEILERNVTAVYSEAKKICRSFEILICDDSSTDATPEISRRLSKRFREITHVRCRNGPSRRENMALAMKSAKGGTIAYLDSDLAVKPEFIRKLLEGIRAGNDIVIGSRYAPGAVCERKLFRSIISKAYNFFMQAYFGSRIRDHQCGFKAFRREAILKLIEELGYDKKFKRGWFWDTELLILAQRRHYRILEIPIVWKYGKRSTFRLMREVRMIPYVLMLKWRYLHPSQPT